VVFAGADPLGTGHGGTKQEAEQEAAHAALQSLGEGADVVPMAPKPGRTSRPRKRRAPSSRSKASAPAGDGAAETAEIVSMVPASDALPAGESQPPVDEPPRSRQFGEID
jgi:hypothetical protein